MTQIAFERLFDRRGGLGTVDHCEQCGTHLYDNKPCDCLSEEDEEDEE